MQGASKEPVLGPRGCGEASASDTPFGRHSGSTESPGQVCSSQRRPDLWSHGKPLL